METILTQNKNPLKLDDKLVAKMLVKFLRHEIHHSGFSKAIVGISGGIDSAVVAYLAVEALGAKNVLGLMLPYQTSSKSSLTDAEKIISNLKIKSDKIEITNIVEPLFKNQKIIDNLRRGNIMARARMIILYDASQKENALVIGTSNKTEILLGYGTQFGDLASALNPIGDLYKTQIISLAKYLGIPKNIISKKPSADLFVGQTDETDFGFTYDEVDRLLYYLVDERMNQNELIEKGFDKKFISKVKKMIQKNQFKRRPPVIAKISNRTVNIDFRYPRDWGI